MYWWKVNMFTIVYTAFSIYFHFHCILHPQTTQLTVFPKFHCLKRKHAPSHALNIWKFWDLCSQCRYQHQHEIQHKIYVFLLMISSETRLIMHHTAKFILKTTYKKIKNTIKVNVLKGILHILRKNTAEMYIFFMDILQYHSFQQQILNFPDTCFTTTI